MFLNSFALFGLAAIAVPVVVHLQKRKKAKVTDWAAMQFLSQSIARRRRGVTLEHFLLLLCRCLLLATFVLALARPVVQSWSDLRMPSVLIGISAAIVAMIYAAVGLLNKFQRMTAAIVSLFLFVASLLLANITERSVNVVNDQPRDVAIVVDCSNSMNLVVDGKSNFQRAIEEAGQLIDALPGGSTVSLFAAGPTTKQINSIADPNLQRASNNITSIKLTGGGSQLQNAIQIARRSLAHGPNEQKQVVALTDNQLSNWAIETNENDDLDLEKNKNDGPSEDIDSVKNSDPTNHDKELENPDCFVRAFDFPGIIKNISLVDVAIRQTTISIHRPSNLEVSIFNSGNQTFDECEIELLIDGELVQSKRIGQLLPGTTQLLLVEHQFELPGYRAISARLVGRDDLESDNRVDRVVNVIDQRRVLLVNGDFTNGFDDRSATFVQLALDPAGLRKKQKTNRGIFQVDRIDVGDLNKKVNSLADYQSVVLCDVSKLPGEFANSISRYVANGGALMVFAGNNLEPGFYNQWKAPGNDASLLPFVISGREGGNSTTPVGIDFDSVGDQALKKMLDSGQHDLTEFLATSYWQLRDRPINVGSNESANEILRFTNGDSLVSEFALQKGRVMFVTTSLHPVESNLIQRVSFPVLMHLWVHRLAETKTVDLNYHASANTLVEIPTEMRDSMDESLISITPGGDLSDVSVNSENGHFICTVGETDVPGLYSIKNKTSGLKAGDEKVMIPFSIATSEKEFNLTNIEPHKFDELTNRFGIGWINQPHQIINIAAGTPGVIELWKYLVFTCLFFVLLESGVQRWILHRRGATIQSTMETSIQSPPALPAAPLHSTSRALEKIA